MNINEIIIKPVITEKGLNQINSQVYTFEVSIKANKFQIKKTVEDMFKVKVENVKTMIRKGKSRRVGKKMKTKKLSQRKFAYVKVSSGKIDLFPHK
ncbi:50S ribosomal protein L23 [Candidatus Roizmanbacteria bacterium RIFCSPHIGHO2_02_FULL_37_13b]|uniref:Large ribosomal subunit protein uL23 n=1 Tax=Candidatus Roizmanbacteria bacterium RIFCSPLOWO2_02_FULL_36_11 TaxID=1802071 RepID=A0A1F7JCJ2_9BACT|nr:MAG: 50S ribosomal protein L23 [Candidatus Roizmanbacteria bacterium RIFCSPHIGHO2_02_FULL_37_13b]OGK53333.1 MAG: 50S ribosomal protein L23 [Candidatus Roizmanbacteria bacterium RIFCSPLOWO2_02_FULL_36_11]